MVKRGCCCFQAAGINQNKVFLGVVKISKGAEENSAGIKRKIYKRQTKGEREINSFIHHKR
jgi:hypothetical protein